MDFHKKYTPKSIQTSMDTDDIFKLLIRMAIPTMVSGVLVSLYNMIDYLFVGFYVGKQGLGALTICGTIQLAFIALTVLWSVGMGMLISQALGAKDLDKVFVLLKTGFSAVFITTLLFSVVMLIFLDSVLAFIGSTQEIISDARSYIQIILVFGFVMPMNGVLASSLRAKGCVKEAMILTVVGVVINIILDPLCIIVFHMGIFGVGFATALAQIIVFLCSLYMVYKEYNISFSRYIKTKIHFSILWRIVLIGMPSGLKLGFMVCSSLIVNRVLQTYGIQALVSFGIVNQFISLFFMAMQSFNLSAQPIISFNYGARKLDRIKKTLLFTAILSFVIGLISTLYFIFAPKWLFNLFTQDVQILKMAKQAAQYMGSLLFLLSLYLVLTGFIQSVGYIRESLYLAILRPIISIILYSTLPKFFYLQGVWLVLPVGEVINAIIAVIFTISVYKMVKYEINNDRNIQEY